MRKLTLKSLCLTDFLMSPPCVLTKLLPLCVLRNLTRSSFVLEGGIGTLSSWICISYHLQPLHPQLGSFTPYHRCKNKDPYNIIYTVSRGTKARYCFTGNFFLPKPCACQLFKFFLLISDLCTISLCLFEKGCIYFCVCLWTVDLVSQARPFSVDHFQYSYPICGRHCCMNRLQEPVFQINQWITSPQDISLENNVWNGSGDTKATKQWSTQRKRHQRRQNQNSLQFLWRLPPWLRAHSWGTSPSGRLLQICISEKTILPIGKTRVGERNSWITSIKKLTWGTSYKGMNAQACHVTIIKKWSCEWKLACAIVYETMISIIVTQFSWFLRSNATCENLFKKLFPCTNTIVKYIIMLWFIA